MFGVGRDALGGGGGAGPLLPVACGRRLFPPAEFRVLLVTCLCGGGGGAGPRLGGGGGAGRRTPEPSVMVRIGGGGGTGRLFLLGNCGRGLFCCGMPIEGA